MTVLDPNIRNNIIMDRNSCFKVMKNNNYLKHYYFGLQCYKVFGQKFSLYWDQRKFKYKNSSAIGNFMKCLCTCLIAMAISR